MKLFFFDLETTGTNPGKHGIHQISWFWANTLDVMVLATNYLLDIRPDMENFKLSTVAATLGVQVDGDSLHNALYDIELTKAVFDIVAKRV